MFNIKVMAPTLANKIAAGEVVEKFSSVVKELVENSIDAGSTIIKVELLASGLKQIKVTDNGVGMNQANAKLAFLAHATSKIMCADDLERINNLGFRGEALPSIAAVSEVYLKSSDGQEGTLIHYKGGELVAIEPYHLRQGTEIIVSNLFYNTPARLKHLGSAYQEYAAVINYLQKIALAQPQISFTLSNEGKVTFRTDGSGKLLKVINVIYGLQVTKKMLPIRVANDDYKVSGYLGCPEITRANRNHITTIVNGRVVRNLELNRVIIDAYHTYIPSDRYPIVVLKIEVDPSLIDVNIHPTKLDLRFSKFEALKVLVEKEITKAFQKEVLIPTVTMEPETSEVVPTFNLERIIQEEGVEYESSPQALLPELYPLGVVQGTYIVCQNELGIYLMDQHAANERVNYEYYYNKLKEPSGELVRPLLPITLELSAAEHLLIKENLMIFAEMGFILEEYGINTMMVRSHPVWLLKGQEIETIKKLIDLFVVKVGAFDLVKFREALAINLSCKMAVKANESISLQEMEALINQLRACTNPWTCPHGRPTVIHFSNYELEKMFKRVM